MAGRWTWAPGVPPAWRTALEAAFDPAALAPAPAVPRRHVAGRDYGVLPMQPAMPFDVFVKVFAHRSLAGRFRHALGREGVAREFDRAVRLHAMGVAVARPLALVRDASACEGRRSFYLMEHLAGAVPLAEVLRDADAAGDASLRRRLLDAAAGCLADLAAKGVCHRDPRPDNLFVPPDGPADAGAVRIIDVRHVAFGVPPAEALRRMLVLLGGFLVRDGAGPEVLEALAAAASAQAAARGGPLAGFRPEGICDEARGQGSALLAREVRKGRRPACPSRDSGASPRIAARAADLDRFAGRYANSGDAENYRARRFGRSQHGRQVDAAERRLVADLLGRLGVRGPVLDVPCGTGRFLPAFAAAGCEVVEADVSAEMLALSRQAAREAGAVCRHVAVDARQLPMAAGRFELVFSMRLLHRVRERAERVVVLRELARVSRRWVLFSFYNRRSARGLRDRLRGRYPGETRSAIRSEADEAGLRVERFLPLERPFGRQTLVLCSVRAKEEA
ncbi:MAG: methyltransferase domain-containing protein [Planctomycetes bacterium]|nr:methyltransferase domain-containing protein [Planctomycetota bacterium]